MLIPNQAKAIELINNSLPYSNQIVDYDLESERNAVRFTWRGNNFRVGLDYCSVEEIEPYVLIGSDLSILAEKLLKNNLGSIL